MKKVLVLLLLFFSLGEDVFPSGDTVFVRAHFLCGSKPKKKFRKKEPRWFGGILGGHAGIEIAPNYIIDFGPRGAFHIFSHRNKRHSGFSRHDTLNFYNHFGTPRDSMQRIIIEIPVTVKQKQVLDSVANAYLKSTPYDYAFIGMRCGAAAYDVLSHIGIVERYSKRKTMMKIFYPRKLRRRLMRKARAHHWKITRYEGTDRRRWEKE
jgi:hypothetical protein